MLLANPIVVAVLQALSEGSQYAASRWLETAVLRRTDAPSRGRAGELAPELAKRLDEVRAIFVRTALDRLLS